MAVTAAWYGQSIVAILNKEADIDTDSMKMMLCTSTYVPDQDNHKYKSDVTNEVVGTAYVAGGAVLASVSVTYTAATNVTKITSTAASWASSTITARYGVIYDASPATDATRPLLMYINFGTDQTTNNGTFQVTPSASGWCTLTAAVEA